MKMLYVFFIKKKETPQTLPVRDPTSNFFQNAFE